MFLKIAAVVSFLLIFGASASANECPLDVAEQVEVAAVNGDGILKLADGRRLRLAAVKLPDVTDELMAEAQRALSGLVLHRKIDIAFDRRSIDRHGDLIAHVFLEPAGWLQSGLVGDGLARVVSQPEVHACIAALLRKEGEARAAKRGLWASARYALRTPSGLDDDIGTFQIVEGTPSTLLSRRDRLYLNFGGDYRTDFTVTISRRNLKRFVAVGLDPVAIVGKKIRVRGWLSLLNGPEMELSHPEQIELVAP